MRFGIIGTADGALPELRGAIELFLRDAGLTQVLYLGPDDAIVRVAEQLDAAQLDADSFLRQAADLACQGTSEAIAQLLAADDDAQRIELVRRLPEPPACAREMLGSWAMLAVHDKAVLEEHDVANAHVPKLSIVIGGSYGAGNYAMCGRGLDPRFIFAWPTSRVSVMGGQQAAMVLRIVAESKQRAKGLELDQATIDFLEKIIVD